MNNVFLSCLLLISVGMLTACGSTPEQAPAGPVPPSLSLVDQPGGGDTVMITLLTLDKPGYVVVHKDNEGKPGPVIGQSELIEPGTYANYPVFIDAEQAGAAVFPMLHYDNGDGVYEFPGPDVPVTADGQVVVGRVLWQ